MNPILMVSRFSVSTEVPPPTLPHINGGVGDDSGLKEIPENHSAEFQKTDEQNSSKSHCFSSTIAVNSQNCSEPCPYK